MANDRTRRDQQPSGWATSGVVFAAAVLMLIGFFQLIAGLTAIFNDDFFVVTRNYTFDLDTTAWGWIHLLFGVLLPLHLLGADHRRWLGGGHGDLPGLAQRGGELLLHPLLPLLGDPPDRARRVGDLVAHTPRCDRGDLDPPHGTIRRG